MIDVTLKLMPTPSSRAADQKPDREGTWSFPEVPRTGDTIRLDEGWSDEVASRAYLVRDVEWPIRINGGPRRALVTAVRVS
jgi:hypothetical protein